MRNLSPKNSLPHFGSHIGSRKSEVGLDLVPVKIYVHDRAASCVFEPASIVTSHSWGTVGMVFFDLKLETWL